MFNSSFCKAFGLGVAGLALTFSTALCAGAQQDSSQAGNPRQLITGNVNDGRSASVGGELRAQRQGQDLGRVGAEMPMENMQLVLRRSPEQQTALNILLDRLNQPGDPLFHAWLTQQEFDETFGLADADILTIREWLQAQGFNITGVDESALVIDFSGTAGAVEQAFHVQIHNYRAADGTTYYANAGGARVPEAMRQAVAGTLMTNRPSHSVQCNALPEPVKRAMERHRAELDEAQGIAREQDENVCGAEPGQGISGETVQSLVTGTLTTLVSFPNGGALYGTLMQASDGNYYGATYYQGGEDNGEIFRITPSGAYTVVYSFSLAGTTDGEHPTSSVVEGTDGNLYGVTENGGASGYGTVFRVSLTGAFTLMHSFNGTTDGQIPLQLVEGTDGNFYGLSFGGGTGNYGVIYKISPTSPYPLTVMHTFTGQPDGNGGTGSLTQGTDGNFYGATNYGGANNTGLIFKISPTSPYTLTSVYSFTAAGTTDGEYPNGALIQGTDGLIYGTAEEGGASGYGTVFKLTPAGVFTLMHSFAGGTSDGRGPADGLEQGSDGNFYGTTYQGGTGNYGTTFVISPTSPYTEAVLDSLGSLEGSFGSLMQGNDGNFYGMSQGSESVVSSTVFKMTVTPTESAPVQLTAPVQVAPSATFTMSYLVTNTYVGTVAGTNNFCFASNTAGDATGWAGTLTGKPTTQSKTLTASATAGIYNYALTCGGFESNVVTISDTLTSTATMTSPVSTSPVSQASGALSAFTVTGQLAWTTSPAPTKANISFVSSAAGTFGATTCTGTASPYTCSATFTPTSTDAGGLYNINLYFSGDMNYISNTSSQVGNYIITAAPTVTVSGVSVPYQSTTAVNVTATESGAGGTASGSVVTFGVTGPATGSFNPATCTISAGSCATTYVPTGTLAIGTYANDITASFSASAQYQAASATSTLTVTDTFTGSLLFSFTGTAGSYPGSSPAFDTLIQGSDGNFYGTSGGGGASSDGVVFKVTPAGAYTELHAFTGGTADGSSPYTGLIEGLDGNFYGTTEAGGASALGSAYQITSGGTFTLLHSFGTGTANGELPEAGLVESSAGVMYGTTYKGGAASGAGYGAVYSMSLTSPYAVSILHAFTTTGTTDGHYPEAGLVQGTNGTFYGTASAGGAHADGTIFSITSGGTFTLLHSFAGTSDGTTPEGTLVQGTDGYLYGTTFAGGTNGDGTVFKLLPVSPYTLVTLHIFAGGTTDGSAPMGALVLGADGNFYGTTSTGGANGLGTAYSITPSGTFLLLHSFAGGTTDGSTIKADLVQGQDGNFYGAAVAGGASSDGAVFKLAANVAEQAPVQLSYSPTSITTGSAFTMSYSVLNADVGTTNGTMNLCLATNTAGDTTGWAGIFAGTPTTATQSLTASATAGTYSYALTCGGSESTVISVTVLQSESLALTAGTPGSSTSGVASTTLTATMTPAVSGVTVTFTDSTTGVKTTAVTNGLGAAATTVTGTTAGPNSYTASIALGSTYGAATSSSVTVYYAGILLSSDLTHDFSIYPGTYDGSPVCNGSNGTNGSTCTSGYGVVVTNFTSTTQNVTVTLNNSGSPDAAFSVGSNCPAGGLAAGAKCNLVFYYLPPYGDGCSLSTTCTTPAGQPGPEGTFEYAMWTVSDGATIMGIQSGGVVTFPTELDGKALLAAGNALSVSPMSLTFGPQAPGAQSTQSVTVTNSGPSSLGITYTLPSGKFAATNSCGAKVAAGANCQIAVTYSDASAAHDSGSMVLTPATGTAITVALTGVTTANTGLSLSSISHNFGNVSDGTSTTFGLSITNKSSGAATVGFSNTAGAGFKLSTNCGSTIAAGASCTYDFTFAPTTPGGSTDSLAITSSVEILPGGTTSAPYTDTVTVTGTGVAGGSFTASTAGHNFGSVAVGSAASPYGVELTNNTGNVITLTLGGGTFASNGAADGYTVETNCGSTLAVNANCELVFGFTPNAVGTTQVMYPVSATSGGNNVPLISGGQTYTGITLTGTGQ